MPILKLLEIISKDRQEALAALIAQTGADVGIDPYQTGQATYWLIEADGALAGYTGVHSIDWKARRCRGIIWVHPDFRRQGIATEAVRVRNDYLFDTWNMNRIEWAVSGHNNASALFSKSRSYAQHEGTLKEAIYFNGLYHDVDLYAVTRRQRDLMLDRRNDFTNPGQGEDDMPGTRVEYRPEVQ